MHSDAQFAGSSSVPAHVEMMGFLFIEVPSNPLFYKTYNRHLTRNSTHCLFRKISGHLLIQNQSFLKLLIVGMMLSVASEAPFTKLTI